MTRFALAFLFAAGCQHASAVRGSGHATHQTRNVPPFEGISVAQGIHVVVETGPLAPLEIEGDDNLVPLVETRVESGRLEIRFSRRFSVWDGGDILVRASAPSVHFLSASGGADIRAELEAMPELE